jgi:Uma2 family endonuclease
MATLVRPRLSESVLIEDVSWELYDLAAREMCHGGTRMVYDNGTLEIMTVGRHHELVKKSAARILEYMAVELDWPLNGFGNVTLRRRDLCIGLEPDECYYINTPMPEPDSTDKGAELNLLKNPPPDLAIEVEITRSSVDKISIYQRIGVCEIWRWTGDGFIILHKQPDGKYAHINNSMMLPDLDITLLASLTTLAIEHGQPAAMRALRNRLRV